MYTLRMPPALYNMTTGNYYESREEMLKQRKIRDNKFQLQRYWKTHYGYIVSDKDFEEFKKHVKKIKRIYTEYMTFSVDLTNQI